MKGGQGATAGRGWRASDMRRNSTSGTAKSRRDIVENEDADFVQGARVLLSRRGRKLRALGPWLAVGAVGLFIWWASHAEIDEVTRGHGKVIPSQAVQIIQSLEGGILEELHVVEGQTVEVGQPLVRIRDVIFASNYQENVARREVLEARLVRLQAEAERSPELTFPPDVRAELVATEGKLFEKRKADRLATQASLESRLKLMRREEELLQTGAASRAVSPIELIRTQKEIAAVVGDLQTLNSNFERLAMEQLDKDRVEYESVVQAIKRDKDRLDRTIIRSEVHGIVNKIYINSVGRVVPSGADIMAIVPLDDTLLLEAYIKPSDIAFLSPGANARVKFTAYDFSIYGGLDGEVERIGADTVTDEPGRPARSAAGLGVSRQEASYYPISVRTHKNTLGLDKNGRQLSIIPGMVAEVDVITGKKTILNYLLSPVYRAKERALRER
ncbi:adhesin transport system membrane fusion protein [Roseimicrobium gellanilyticum]|uniref:Adhesin transport system membrane fusion protein n=2 Tax=Roseimicrobium gellanilyticum TaxID=748857 RepID=A0A366HQU3_9BACT|nr:adhesin transport system membrane fusion protein [Roseimicrobium gellanilyticum]